MSQVKQGHGGPTVNKQGHQTYRRSSPSHTRITHTETHSLTAERDAVAMDRRTDRFTDVWMNGWDGPMKG